MSGSSVVIFPQSGDSPKRSDEEVTSSDPQPGRVQSDTLVKVKIQEERFQRLIDEVEDYAIILLDKNGIITTWNKGAQKVKGYTPDEIIGRSFKVFYAKEDRDALLPDRLLNLADTTGKATHEGWRVRKDGTRFWGNITITAIHNDQNEVAGYLKVTRDLTERKIAEDKLSNYIEQLTVKNDELRISEQRYHKMVNEVSDYVIILLDKTGKILDWNKGAERIKGYKASEIVGKSFKLFYTKEDKEKNLPELLLAQAKKNGSVLHEGWRIRKDGTRFWGSVAITALHDDNGDVFGFSKVTRDLTDRKIAEDMLNNVAEELKFRNEELRQSEERYQRMIAEVKDYAIILLDTNGIIQNWNEGARQIKGYDRDEIIGKSFEQFYQESDRNAGFPKKLLREAAEHGRVIHEGWRVRKDGTKFWGNVVITALHGDDGNIIGFSKVTRDLTITKRADDLLKASAIELDRKNKSLERLNQEVSSFAYVASHDLKEPLRKIQTFGLRINDENDVSRIKEFADKIITSAGRMQKLMDDLLSYSQVSNDTSLFAEVDLNKVVLTVKNDLDLLIHEKAASLVIESLPVIRGVEFQWHQLFANLFANALKFSKPAEPPVITVKSSKVPGKEIPLGIVNDLREYFHITIADNGIGFDEQDSKRIFDVFQRLHSRSEFMGTGIGLAIVKRVVENHGGMITATGQPGVGATFNIYIPA
jgi:PAS domain S-box-containing protein